MSAAADAVVEVGHDVRLVHLGVFAAGGQPGPPTLRPTYDAAELRQFQRTHGLPVDGRLDPRTTAVLQAAIVTAVDRWLEPGHSGRLVELAQRALALAGHDGGGVDGDFGGRTREAVRQHQRRAGLQLDGIVGPATWASLTGIAPARFRRILEQDARGDDVRWVQAVLGALGLRPGPVDGRWGAQTDQAVRAFQSSIGQAADGVIGRVTWLQLDRRAARPTAVTIDAAGLVSTFVGARPVAIGRATDGLIAVDLDDLSPIALPTGIPTATVAHAVATGAGEPALATIAPDGTCRVTELATGTVLFERSLGLMSPEVAVRLAAARAGDAIYISWGPDVGTRSEESGVMTLISSGDVERVQHEPITGDLVLVPHDEHVRVAWIDSDGKLVLASAPRLQRLADQTGADAAFERLLVGGPASAPVLVTRSPSGLIERWSAGDARPLAGIVEPDGRATALLATTAANILIGTSEGRIARVRLEDGASVGDGVVIPADHVVELAASELDGRSAMAAVDAGGRLWAWTDPPASVGERPSLRTGRTPLLGDQPADVDQLGRQHLADEVAALIRGIAATDQTPAEAFALHLDAPWGAGKTTLVRFVVDRLRAPPAGWVTVELDAWRSSQLSPAWWALLSHLRRGVRESLSGWSRLRLDIGQLTHEIGRLWRLWFPLVVVAAALLLVWGMNADLQGTMAAATTTAAFVVAVGGLGTRLFSLGSIQGARLHERLNDNPMEEVADRISWLRRRAGRPILLVLDDLDRCNERFTVELLDAVQTLLRNPSDRARRPTAPRPPPMVVLAVGDRRWLRAAYEHAYAVFSPYVSEPGRPLGDLFLDKLFQVRVELPHLSSNQVEEFVATLLRSPDGVDGDAAAAPDAEEIAARIRATPLSPSGSATSIDDRYSDLLREASALSPGQRQQLAGVALQVRRADPQREVRERHLLEQYAELLEPNPRAAKRFLMAYNLVYAARLTELEPPDAQTLALWTVVTTRWPALADWVRDQLPDGSLRPTGEPGHPSELLGEPEVQRIVRSSLGGPLGRPQLLRCTGYSRPAS